MVVTSSAMAHLLSIECIPDDQNPDTNGLRSSCRGTSTARYVGCANLHHNLLVARRGCQCARDLQGDGTDVGPGGRSRDCRDNLRQIKAAVKLRADKAAQRRAGGELYCSTIVHVQDRWIGCDFGGRLRVTRAIGLRHFQGPVDRLGCCTLLPHDMYSLRWALRRVGRRHRRGGNDWKTMRRVCGSTTRR